MINIASHFHYCYFNLIVKDVGSFISYTMEMSIHVAEDLSSIIYFGEILIYCGFVDWL